MSESNFYMKLGAQLGWTTSAVLLLHGSDSNVRRAKQTHEQMCFGAIAFPRVELLRGFKESWIWYDSGTTSESDSCFRRATVKINCNQ